LIKNKNHLFINISLRKPITRGLNNVTFYEFKNKF
jgi:hypothetical protein